MSEIDSYLASIKDKATETAIRKAIELILLSSGGLLDQDLLAIAALSGTSGLLRKTGVNSWELDTTDYSGSGTLDADLTAIAALAGTSGILKKIAANTWELDTTSYLSGTVGASNGGTGLTALGSALQILRVNSGGTALEFADPSVMGANGTRTAKLEMYQWAISAPTTFPSGNSTYTWATGTFTAPSTLNGWSVAIPAAVPGQTLWGITATFADTLTTTTSVVPWSSTAPYTVGYAGLNGIDGTDGINGVDGFTYLLTRTSTTSNTIDLGSKTFTYAATNLGWVAGATRLRAANTSTNWMEGTISAISTGSVTIDVDTISGGAGPFTSWNLVVSGDTSNTYSKSEIDTAITDLQLQINIATATSAELTALRNSIIATPSLAPPIGTRYVVSDGLLQNMVVTWNGDSFDYKGRIASIYSATGVNTRTSNNSTDNTWVTMASMTIPGFLLGKNSQLRITPLFKCDASVSNKQIRVLFTQAGSTLGAMAGLQITNTSTSGRFLFQNNNCNAYNAQISLNAASYVSVTQAIVSTDINTVNDFVLNIQSEWNANEATPVTITLLGYTVESD